MALAAYDAQIQRCQTAAADGANQIYTALDELAVQLNASRLALNANLATIRSEIEATSANNSDQEKKKPIAEYENELNSCKDKIAELFQTVGVVNVVRRVSKSINAAVTQCVDTFPNENSSDSSISGHPCDDLAAVCLECDSPPLSLVLQTIAKHFLHLNRLDLFETLREEAKEKGVLFLHPSNLSTDDNNTATTGLLDDTLPISSPSLDLSAVQQPDASFSTSGSLVPDKVVAAYTQLHSIVAALKQGQVTTALKWFKEQIDVSGKLRDGDPARLLFALHEVQFLDLLTSATSDSNSNSNTNSNSNNSKNSRRNKKIRNSKNNKSNKSSKNNKNNKNNSNSVAVSTTHQAPAILKYVRQNFSPFLAQLRPEVSRLIGSLAYCGSLDKSPYSAPQPQATAWDHLARDFQRRFCLTGTTIRVEDGNTIMENVEEGVGDQTLSVNRPKGRLVKLPLENPLAVIVAAGMVAFPQIIALIRTLHKTQPNWMSTELSKWKKERKIPVEIDLGPPFHFHSTFSCPICRSPDHDTLSGTACRLPCGHVICRSCIGQLSVRTRRQHGMKCPVCPKQILQSDIQELVFDWIPAKRW